MFKLARSGRERAIYPEDGSRIRKWGASARPDPTSANRSVELTGSSQRKLLRGPQPQPRKDKRTQVAKNQRRNRLRVPPQSTRFAGLRLCIRFNPSRPVGAVSRIGNRVRQAEKVPFVGREIRRITRPHDRPSWGEWRENRSASAQPELSAVGFMSVIRSEAFRPGV